MHASKSPSGVPVMLDSYLKMIVGARTSTEAPPPSEDAVTGPMGLFCIPRHGSFVNCLFMDWSVRKVGLKELWTLKWHRRFNTAGPWNVAGGVKPGDWPEWMRAFKDY